MDGQRVFEENEQRVFERIPVNLAVRVIDVDCNKETEANTCDISAKGLGIVSKEPFKLDDVLEFWLKMPDKKEPFYTWGRVAWTRLENNNEYRTGVCLEKAEFMGFSRLFTTRRIA